MTLKLMGKKVGMTQRFDKEGNCLVCTVISVEPNVVTGVKAKEKDGYDAVQSASFVMKGKSAERKIGKPMASFYKKLNIEPRRRLLESRLVKAAEQQVGQELGVGLFAEVGHVDVTSTSKGKGYQGVMKLHGYAGIGRSHGTGPVHRHAGSIGMRSTPGRCLPGGKRASRMGGRRTTVQNLKVVLVDTDRNLIIVKGAVPGANGCCVYVAQAKKKTV